MHDIYIYIYIYIIVKCFIVVVAELICLARSSKPGNKTIDHVMHTDC
jgi:hypothetical protein